MFVKIRKKTSSVLEKKQGHSIREYTNVEEKDSIDNWGKKRKLRREGYGHSLREAHEELASSIKVGNKDKHTRPRKTL